MLNAKAFANAVTAVTAVVYVICLLLSLAVPDVLLSVAQSWAHSLSLEGMKTTQTISAGSAAVGLVTISLLAWVTTYTTIWLYDRWAGRGAPASL
jgi:uncharacterized protein DUF5676